MTQPHRRPDTAAHEQTAEEVPLTVWACGQQVTRTPPAQRLAVLHAGILRTELAGRIITAFSRPGDLVLDPMCGVGVCLVEAARRNRHAIGVVPDDRWVRLVHAHLGHACTTRERQRVRVATNLGPSDVQEYQGEVDLVLTAPPARWLLSAQDGPAEELQRPDSRGHVEAIAGAYAGWARVLRPGGLLVTVTRTTRVHGVMPKITGTAIRLAQEAGLRYMQHIVALRVPVRDGGLAADTDRCQRRPCRRRFGEPAGAARVCRVIHDDVLVFAKPRCPRPSEVAQ